jgi:hypothetical protein
MEEILDSKLKFTGDLSNSQIESLALLDVGNVSWY